MEEMDQLKRDVAEIKSALIGNKEMNQKGLVHKVDCNARYIEKDKQFKQKAVGVIAGIQLMIGAFVTWFKLKV